MEPLASLADLFASTPSASPSALPRQAVAPVRNKSQKFLDTIGKVADAMAGLGQQAPSYQNAMRQEEARTRQQAQQNLFATLYNQPDNEFARQDFLAAGGDIRDIAALEQMNAPPKPPAPSQIEKEYNFIAQRMGPQRAEQYIQQKFKMTPEQVQAVTVGGVRGVDVRDEAGNIVGFRPMFDARRTPGASGGGARPAPTATPAPSVPGVPPKVAEAADKKFATSVYQPWVLEGGRAEALRRVEQLQAVRNMIARNPDIVGGLSGYLPDTARSMVNREGLTAQQQFEEVVQSNLRQVLGGQFAAKEGEGVLARAFDPKAPAADNLTRLDRLLGQISAAIQAKDEAVQRFEQTGTSVRPRTAGGAAQPSVTPTATDAQGRKIMWNGTAWVPMR